MKMTLRGRRLIALILGFAVVAIGAGSGGVRAFAEERYAELQLFAKVLNLVQQYYVEDVDTKKLIYGGIKGMLRELDPHTNFLPPDIFKEFESETTGEFGGIGIEITVQNGLLTVISPIEDTPAFKAGIKSGDKIIDINGESTKGFSLAEAAQRMKGKKGQIIKMGIFRDGFEKPQSFAIERGVVKIKSVKYTDLDQGYAYVPHHQLYRKFGHRPRESFEDPRRQEQGHQGFDHRPAPQSRRIAGSSGADQRSVPGKGHHRQHHGSQPKRKRSDVRQEGRHPAQLPGHRAGG